MNRIGSFFVAYIVVFCALSTLNAQSVTINLSVEWERSMHFAPIANANDTIPYLVVEYGNTTDSAYYLQRIVAYKGNEFPVCGESVLMNYGNPPPNWYELALRSSLNYTGEKHIVTMDDAFIVEDSNGNKRGLSIYNVHEFLNRISYFGSISIESYYYWEENDFIPEAVRYYENHKDENEFSIPFDSIMMLERYRKNLVFLPPRSKVIHRYNLIGFWYVGGEYLFKLPDNYQPPRSVYDKTFRYLLDLPDSIDGFKLYKGTIKSNETLLKESTK